MSCHPAPAGDGGSATHQFSSLQVEEGDDPAITAKVVRKVDRHLIPWLFFLAVVCYLDRTNLSFAAVQLSRDLGLSCSAYGLGAGLFFIGYFCFQVPSNMILARVGAPIWLSATVIAWGFVAGSFAFLNGTTMFLILRVALGMAECGTFPGIWLHLSKFYTPRELGRAYATVATSTALAQVIGAPLAAGILSMDGALGLRGWQWLFLTEGTSTIVFGILLRAFLVLSPEKAGFLTQEERTWLQRRQEQQLTSRGDTSFAAQKKALLRKSILFSTSFLLELPWHSYPTSPRLLAFLLQCTLPQIAKDTTRAAAMLPCSKASCNSVHIDSNDIFST